MAKWAITYNGFGTEGASAPFQWSHVHVNSQSSEPVYGDDGISVETVRHTINGTALISADTDAAFRVLLLNAREHLTRPPMDGLANSLKVWLDYSSGTGTQEITAGQFSANSVAGIDTEVDTEQVTEPETVSVYYYGAQEDDYGIPRCTFDINEIYGTKTAIISFTITWHKLEPPIADVDWEVIHHSWTQTYDIDNNGLTTLTIEGDLKVRHFMDGEQNFETTARGTNPDRYRTLVMPSVPPNFRVQNMNWATDRTGNRLMYRITLREHARALPFPAKTGSGRFSYHRDHGSAYLGMKVFDGELEGDAKTDPRSLLNTLIRVAASRIMFGGSGVSPGEPGATPVDRILAVTVTEHDIFSKKRIGLRITAQGLQTTSPSGQTNDPNGPMGLGFNLLDKFFDSDDPATLAERPNAYGSGLIQSIKRQMFVPWNPGTEDEWVEKTLPRALWRRADEWEGEELTLVVDSEELEEITPPPVGEGDHANSDIEATGHAQNPYTHVSGSESISVNSNVVVMSGQSMNSVDIPVQVGKPVVIVESEYQLTRTKIPPKRLLMSKPANAIILSESFDVNRGAIDANNNNTYVAVYRRVVRLLDDGNGRGFYNATLILPDWGKVEMRSWWPVEGALTQPIDPRVEGQELDVGSVPRVIFDIEGTNPEIPSWKLGPAPPVYGVDA